MTDGKGAQGPQTWAPDLDQLIQGVDVYHGDGPIDWPALYGAGIRFAYLKCREGSSFRDDTAADHFAKARAAGILCGGYLFFHAMDDPTEQCGAFADDLLRIGGRQLMPAVDLEWDNGSDTTGRPDRWKLVPKNERCPRITQGLVTLQRRTGRHPIAYFGQQWADEDLGGLVPGGWPLRLWLYGDKVPKGFPGWIVKQRSTAKIWPGHPDALDSDVFAGHAGDDRDLQNLQSLCRTIGATP